MNETFWSRELLAAELYTSLEDHGVSIDRSVLIECFPDSGSTWVLRLMDQNGETKEFDLDIDDSGNDKVEVLNPSISLKRRDAIKRKLVLELHRRIRSAT